MSESEAQTSAALRGSRKTKEITPGVHFHGGFGNTTFIVGSDAVAVVDPGLFVNGPNVLAELLHRRAGFERSFVANNILEAAATVQRAEVEPA
jgi:hypothetical protein